MNFWNYIKHRIKWLVSVLFCGLVMVAVMIVNHIPNEEILYGMVLCLILWGVIAVTDFCGCQKRYKKMQELMPSITVSMEKLEATDEPVEEMYQELLHRLFDENMRRENEMIYRQRDLMEYYTMWVHQIKTPIAALKLLLEEAMTEELQEDPAEEGEDKMWEAQAAREERRQEEMQELFRIEQYAEMALQYMRLDSETTDFIFEKVELDRIIREAVRKYARQFIRKKIALNYEGVNTTVLTDEKWLEFVIEQLLANALKYTLKGSISIYMEEGQLIIADTGIGIREEDLPRVCEKGYTGYNGHADKRSTGIGLYLCHRALKKLGHSFSIESREGQGTLVKIGFEQESE